MNKFPNKMKPLDDTYLPEDFNNPNNNMGGIYVFDPNNQEAIRERQLAEAIKLIQSIQSIQADTKSKIFDVLTGNIKNNSKNDIFNSDIEENDSLPPNFAKIVGFYQKFLTENPEMRAEFLEKLRKAASGELPRPFLNHYFDNWEATDYRLLLIMFDTKKK